MIEGSGYLKRVFIGFSFMLILSFALSEHIHAKGFGKDITVKVMSYNIHHAVGLDNELSLPSIANVIKETNADIIAIQEVDRYFGERSQFVDQARELAKLVGYHYTFGANLNLKPAPGQVENRQYGTAILSKYPIIDSKNIHLSSDGEQRGLLIGKVNVRGVHLTVFNTHLGLSHVERMGQVEEIIEISSYYNEPTVLMGDLNAEPKSKELERLQTGLNVVDTFKDVVEANTYPVLHPTKRIDYILTSSDVTYKNSNVHYSESSDHLPIVVDITLKR